MIPYYYSQSVPKSPWAWTKIYPIQMVQRSGRSATPHIPPSIPRSADHMYVNCMHSTNPDFTRKVHHSMHSPSNIRPSGDNASDIDHEEELTRKRRRPNSLVACDGCQKRKCRCDMLAGDVCYRCRTLRVDCLFGGRPISGGRDREQSTPGKYATFVYCARSGDGDSCAN
jgi:hypothetical protein